MTKHQKHETDSQGAHDGRSELEARGIKETSGPAVLATILGKTWGKVAGSNGFQRYHDDILSAAGAPDCPIETMMIEQLLLAHHRLGDLLAESACADNPEVAALFNNSAVRLMAEFRKTTLALQEFRTPKPLPNVTHVGQQNIAAGNQQIAYLDRNNGQQRREENGRSEVASNKPEAINHEQRTNAFPQSAEGRSGQEEPVEARRDHSRRASATAGVGVRQQTVDSVDRP